MFINVNIQQPRLKPLRNENNIFRLVYNRTPHFFKKFLIVLCIILAINTIAKPKDTQCATVFLGLTIAEICTIIGAVTGIAGAGIYGYDVYKKHHSETTEEDFTEFFNNEITIDGDGNYILSDDAMVVVNEIKEDVEERITWAYGYVCKSEDLGMEWFSDKIAYNTIQSVLNDMNNYVFSIYNPHGFMLDGERYFVLKGMKNVGAMVSDGFEFTDYFVSVYDENWRSYGNDSGQTYIVDIYVGQTTGSIGYYNMNDEFISVSSVSDIDFDNIKKSDMHYNKLEMYKYNGVECRNIPKPSDDYGHAPMDLITSGSNCFKVYKSYDDMKKDDVDGEGQFLDTYTNGTVTNNTVTTEQITNYNNCINGDGNNVNSNNADGDGDGSSDDSGGLLDSLLGSIGKLFSALMKILNALISMIADAIDVIIGGFTSVTDLIQNGFTDFMSALFPYIPSEWIACITLSLSLMVFGIIIKFFIK